VSDDRGPPPATAAGVDPRVAAYCRPDGPEVFSSIAHGAQIFDRDPFDVESIHAEARAAFQRQLDYATRPALHQGGAGKTLLVLGGAGSGKTHLMRAFRTAVHERGYGYVGYLQMSSDVGDYARYVLSKLVDSLDRPYDAPDRPHTGLAYLSDGLADHAGALTAADRDRLRDGDLEGAALASFVGRLVDRLVQTPELATVDTDLLQALLLLQRGDPAIHRRVVKFLRCESLTSYERELLGGLAPRLAPEDPARTIVQLGQLAYQLQLAALVLLIDQIEDAIPDPRGHERIQRAFDAVRKITDELPSAIVVVACLEDVYDQIRTRLTASLVDRLEREPPPVRLAASRGRGEIELLLARRLQHLYDEAEVAWRDDDPLFPFRPEHLDLLVNQRARDCLAFFHRHRERCIHAAALVEPEQDLAPPTATPALAAAPALDDLDRAWNDHAVGGGELPDDELGLLRLIERGVRACADELGLALPVTLDERARPPRLTVAPTGHRRRLIEICNRKPQGGHLGRQIEGLRALAGPGVIPVALRSSEFSFLPRSEINRKVGELIAAGGRALTILDGDLRALAGHDAFVRAHTDHPRLAAWRRSARPIASLELFRRLLDLDELAARPAASEPEAEAAAPAPAPPPPAAPAAARAPAPAIAAPALDRELHLGTLQRGDPVTLDPERLKVHAAFLGTTGSGKTTVALNLVEQLLARGVSAVLVDRKGDLARYASPAWWDERSRDPDRGPRVQALRGRVKVDLFTPGSAAGRPLRIPIIPAGMPEMTTDERELAAAAAASGLAAMIGYGRSEGHRKRAAILKKAIELHADASGATLADLQETIARPDPQLLAAVGNLTRHFSAVAEDLDTLAIHRGALLTGDGEPLDVAAMLAPTLDGRSRLTILSAVALTDVGVLQFFVSRLLVELARAVRRHPQPTLRAVALFDEADSYIPAVAAPPTKEPMFELLRRARAGGLGVFLATQNPGDLDYRARDNISTWLIGRVAQPRAIDKMRPLLGDYPDVATRLAQQTTGSFFLLNPELSRLPRELRAAPSLMKTDQLQEHEIATLARATADRG
jgi:GTPase SAR1 family protein